MVSPPVQCFTCFRSVPCSLGHAAYCQLFSALATARTSFQRAIDAGTIGTGSGNAQLESPTLDESHAQWTVTPNEEIPAHLLEGLEPVPYSVPTSTPYQDLLQDMDMPAPAPISTSTEPRQGSLFAALHPTAVQPTQPTAFDQSTTAPMVQQPVCSDVPQPAVPLPAAPAPELEQLTGTTPTPYCSTGTPGNYSAQVSTVISDDEETSPEKKKRRTSKKPRYTAKEKLLTSAINSDVLAKKEEIARERIASDEKIAEMHIDAARASQQITLTAVKELNQGNIEVQRMADQAALDRQLAVQKEVTKGNLMAQVASVARDLKADDQSLSMLEAMKQAKQLLGLE